MVKKSGISGEKSEGSVFHQDMLKATEYDLVCTTTPDKVTALELCSKCGVL